jgi:hypothetical protein
LAQRLCGTAKAVPFRRDLSFSSEGRPLHSNHIFRKLFSRRGTAFSGQINFEAWKDGTSAAKAATGKGYERHG